MLSCGCSLAFLAPTVTCSMVVALSLKVCVVLVRIGVGKKPSLWFIPFSLLEQALLRSADLHGAGAGTYVCML